MAQPTKQQILEALKKEGITDLDTLAEHAEKIAQAKAAGQNVPTTSSAVHTAGWFIITS